MPDKSSSSVKITYFDRERALREVRQGAQRLYRRYPEIEAIYLFGSLATGGAVPGSDADLLIVLRGSELKFFDRMPRYQPDGVSIDVDVFPYSQHELDHMIQANNAFVRRALETGVKLEKPAP